MSETLDATRLTLLLTEPRLPATKQMRTTFAERSDEEGWPAARLLMALPTRRVDSPVLPNADDRGRGGVRHARRRRGRHLSGAERRPGRAGLPPERTTCVEISGLRCEILRARGYLAHKADFIAWAAAQRATSTRYDRCLMNPPFADGRALAHLYEASTLIQAGGRLVAILPASLRGKDLLEGWKGECSGVFANEFAGTGVSVAIYAASRP